MAKFLNIILALFCIALFGSIAFSQAAEAPADPGPAAAVEPAADEARINRLIEGLKDWNTGRANAAELAKIGPPAVPALIAALKSKEKGTRGNAARALGEIEAEEATGPLGELLNDSEYWITRNAVYALGHIGTPEAVVFLKQALAHPRPDVQEAALWSLDELQEQSAIPAISDLMVSASDQYVRWRAMTVVRSLKEGEEISFLIKTLDNPEAEIDRRRNAAVMLGSLKAEAAAPSLVRAMDDKDAGLRWRSIEALGELGGQSARPAIEAKLVDPDEDVRMFAVGTLGVLGSEESIKPLKGLLTSSNSQMRMNIIRSLKKIGGPAGAEAISGALSDGDGYVQTMAIESLAELKATEDANKIKLLAKNQSPSVRAAVMRALGELAPGSAREVLEGGKTDNNAWVRYEAERALKKGGDGK